MIDYSWALLYPSYNGYTHEEFSEKCKELFEKYGIISLEALREFRKWEESKSNLKVESDSFHPFNTESCKKRLVEEYETHGKLVVGFDFDNTIFDYHNNGGNYSVVINLLKRCKDLGFTLCLSTSEFEQDKIDWKIKYCEYYGIKPDYINESPILKGTKKPFFSILLDDRAGLESAYYTLLHVVNYAETKLNKSREE